MNVLLIVDKVLNHYDNMKSLLEEQVVELTSHKNIMKLSPDLETYKVLDDNNTIYGVFAYLDGKLIGYSLNIVAHHLHYSDLIYVTNDILYVDKLFRNKGVGEKIMKESEIEANKRGAKMFLQKAKPSTPLYELLNNSSDYRLQEMTFIKVL
jgi:GNAT superfamily N-acetyltransferase